MIKKFRHFGDNRPFIGKLNKWLRNNFKEDCLFEATHLYGINDDFFLKYVWVCGNNRHKDIKFILKFFRLRQSELREKHFELSIFRSEKIYRRLETIEKLSDD